MYKVSQTDIASIELFSGNILSIVATPRAVVDLEGAERLIRAIDAMLPNDENIKAAILDLTDISEIHPEAIDYLLSGDYVQANEIAAVALTATSITGKFIAQAIALRQSRKGFPVQYFESPIAADHWVRKQLNVVTRASSKSIDLKTVNYVVEPYEKVAGRVSASN